MDERQNGASVLWEVGGRTLQACTRPSLALSGSASRLGLALPYRRGGGNDAKILLSVPKQRRKNVLGRRGVMAA